MTNEETQPAQSHSEIMVAKIKSILEGRPDDDVASYEIAGRRVDRFKPTELMRWLEFYERRVEREANQKQLSDGGRNSRIIIPRFR